MISSSAKEEAVSHIKEALKSGAPLCKACKALEISRNTFYRWSICSKDQRLGASKSIPRKLSESEKQSIIDKCCDPRFIDDNPYKIHAALLDEGIYIASVSSFYRILREKGLLTHRRKGRSPRPNPKPPEKVATGPNQVWCWDITWLKTDVRGHYFYAYTIIDIWDRSIVKWQIHDREDNELAKELFESALRDAGMPSVWIHSDNGNPMKGASLLGLFYQLNLGNSYSRPRVSNDNPFIESWFKTLKYGISYPDTFTTLCEARNWFGVFVDKYNTTHRHSGLNYLTPEQVRNGHYSSVVSKRNRVMEEAYLKNPERWSQPVKWIDPEHRVVLNPASLTRAQKQTRSKEKIA